MDAQNKIAQNMFLGMLFVWLLYVGLYITTNFQPLLGGQGILKAFSILTMVILFCKEIISAQTYNLNSGVLSTNITLLIFVILSINYANHNDGLLSLSMIALIISSRNINVFKLLRVFTLAEGILLLLTIISSKIGLIATVYMPSDDGTIRSSLGFGYVSFASHHAFFLICAYLILRNSKIKYWELCILLFIVVYLYKLTGTSSPFYLSLLALLYDFLVEKILKRKLIVNNKFLSIFAGLSFVIAFVIVIYFCTLASPNLVAIADKITHNRLHLSIEGMKNFGITAFGQKINFITLDIFGNYSGQYNYIDSSYIQSLVVNGWLFTAVIIYLYSYAVWWAIKRKYELITAFLVLAAIQGMFDPQMFVLWYSPFVIVLGKCFSTGDLIYGKNNL